jgi:hypothetical protein
MLLMIMVSKQGFIYFDIQQIHSPSPVTPQTEAN